MGTTSVISTAGVRVWNLTQRVVNVHIVWSMSRVSNGLQVFAGEFIGAQYSFQIPVRPVEHVIEHADRKDMGNLRPR